MVKLPTLDSTAPTFTRTHCPYCALQCGMELRGEREWALVTGDLNFPANRGALCVKGWTAASTLGHPERLLAPLARQGRGLVEVPWDEALDRDRGKAAVSLRSPGMRRSTGWRMAFAK